MVLMGTLYTYPCMIISFIHYSIIVINVLITFVNFNRRVAQVALFALIQKLKKFKI
jgi:hypothetical protein